MRKLLVNFLLFLSISTLIVNCANRGRPSGGDKDITPPEITKSEPENFSLDFNEREIKISFNEYIKIKNLQNKINLI